MMRRIRTSILLAIISICTYAQTNKTLCKCPEPLKDNNPDTTFYFSNGQTIVLCGYKGTLTIQGKSIFSEFTLAVCGQEIGIKFWGALQHCIVHLNKDTLFIEELKYLPIGDSFNFTSAIWTIERIYFAKGKVQKELTMNGKIKKYTEQQIQQTLKEYETAKTGHDESKLELADKIFYQLFMSAITGNKKAREYFKESETKFGPLDGYLAEDYDELITMLKLWDKKQKE